MYLLNAGAISCQNEIALHTNAPGIVVVTETVLCANTEANRALFFWVDVNAP